MTLNVTATLLISLFALGVAFYGIFERQRASYSAMRVRITELLADAEALNVEEDKYREELYADQNMERGAPKTGFALASITARRALLTYQALALLHRLQRVRYGLFGDLRLTPSEHGSLALSLMRCSDLASARKQWEAALASPGDTTVRVRAANHSGFAGCLFDLGEIPAAREHYLRAVRLHPDNNMGRRLAFATCLDWLDREKTINGELTIPVREARKIAEGAPPEWGYPALMDLRRAATRTIHDAGKGAYMEEVAGFDDLPPADDSRGAHSSAESSSDVRADDRERS